MYHVTDCDIFLKIYYGFSWKITVQDISPAAEVRSNFYYNFA